MNRFAPYLGIIGALIIGVFFAVIFDSLSVTQTAAPTSSSASSTISVLPSSEPPQTTTQFDEPVKPEENTKLEQVAPIEKPSIQKSAPVVETQTNSTPVSALTALTQSESASLDASASTLREALVNIICFSPAGRGIRSISGSGVIVDEKGIILTNAHIAQYFLLVDLGVSCTIRAGSPARDSYKASLAYIPPAWIKANSNILTQKNPSGTGEYDFAFLAISKSVTSAALPNSFTYISLATTPPNVGTPVVIGSYGAQFLESSQIQSSLFPTLVFGSVKDVFTFASTTVDVLALGGSAAAQEGSSGGGVSNIRGELIGTITTSTVKGATDTRSLSAITASYIRSAYASETGQALDLLLSKPTATSIADFAQQMPALESILTSNL